MYGENELHHYVARPDAAYRWDRLAKRRLGDGMLHDLRMVSQKWQGHLWAHRLHLYVPGWIAAPEWALLTIGADHPGGDGATHLDFDLADRLGIPVAHLYDIPNQPLFDGLREDELLAHTLTQRLETGDETWPLLYPMVKAAARALDTVAAMCAEEAGSPPTRFVLHGASKRGWTTWLAAVTDPRVAAIIPEVYDNLNLFAQMPHQVRVWHAYSEMIEDYTEQRLQEKMRTPEGRRLALTIDPYSYRDTLTLPKLLIHSLNDRYWATDALNLYWDDLPGDKHLLYVPNQPHNIADRVHVRPAIAAFVQAVLSDARLPVLAAEFRETEEALDVTLRAGPPALEARLWSATAPTQDFRAALWEPLPLERSAAQGAFAAHIARPSSGFAALVADCLLSDPGEPYLLSSRVHILGSSPD